MIDGGASRHRLNSSHPPQSEIMQMQWTHESWGRLGFDAGNEAVQGMPRSSYLVKQAGNTSIANDERFALAA